MACSVEGCLGSVRATGLCRYHYHKAWSILHPEKVAAKQKKYRIKNKDKHSKSNVMRVKGWRKADTERARESYRVQNRRWREKNPVKAALLYQIDRAKRKQYPKPTFTAEQWQGVVDWYQGRCAYCFVLCASRTGPAKLTCDHIHPLARGGSNDISNVVPACRTCNSSKGKKLLAEWLTL